MNFFYLIVDNNYKSIYLPTYLAMPSSIHLIFILGSIWHKKTTLLKGKMVIQLAFLTVAKTKRKKK